MKLSMTTFMLCLFGITIFGQSNGNEILLSHNITTEIKDVASFDKIDVSEDFNVFVRFSNKEPIVKIEANENLHDLIKVENKNGTLKISTKSYSIRSGGGKESADEKLVAYITTKSLVGIKGDEDVTIKLEDKLEVENLTIDLDEDCKLEGHLEVANLHVMLDEDSVLDIKGAAEKMQVEVSEDSMIKGLDFQVEDLDIDLSGDSEAKLTVNGSIALKASGDSLFYKQGEGKFTKKRLSGSAKVTTW